jgi:hypothetical protein
LQLPGSAEQNAPAIRDLVSQGLLVEVVGGTRA